MAYAAELGKPPEWGLAQAQRFVDDRLMVTADDRFLSLALGTTDVSALAGMIGGWLEAAPQAQEATL